MYARMSNFLLLYRKGRSMYFCIMYVFYIPLLCFSRLLKIFRTSLSLSHTWMPVPAGVNYYQHKVDDDRWLTTNFLLLFLVTSVGYLSWFHNPNVLSWVRFLTNGSSPTSFLFGLLDLLELLEETTVFGVSGTSRNVEGEREVVENVVASSASQIIVLSHVVE